MTQMDTSSDTQPSHPRIKTNTGWVHGPYVVLVTHGDAKMVVAPPGGFQTLEETTEWCKHWAEADDQSTKEFGHGDSGSVQFEIQVLRDLASFKNFMSF